MLNCKSALTILSGVLGIVIHAHAQDPAFPGQLYETGTTFSFTTAIGDINHDGKNDVVTASSNDGTISVLPGLGNGQLGAPALYTLAGTTSAWSMILRDMNSDGNLDIIVTSSSHLVQILAGNNSGGFAGPVSYNTGMNPYAIVAVDLNNDGKLDLVTANNGTNTVSGLLANNSGGYLLPVGSSAGSLPYAIDAADFDNDGKNDVVVANNTSPGNVSILRGTGHGTFLAPTTLSTGANPHSVAALDVNADGLKDIVASCVIADALTVWVNLGGGVYSSSSVPAGDYPSWVTTADFNLDGRVDCAVANEFGNTVSLMLAAGAPGSFGAPASTPTGGAPALLSNGDLNQDGRPDLVTGHVNGTNTVTVLLNSASGFVGALSLPVGTTPLNATVGDLNHDGRNDVVSCNYTGVAPGSISVLLAQSANTYNPATNYTTGFGPQYVRLADLDGDSNLDAAVANGLSNTLSIFKGNGLGGFVNSATLTVGSYPWFVAAGDLNQDGRPDLLVVNRNGPSVSVLLANGAGGFLPAQTIVMPNQSQPFGVDMSDLNQDGSVDVVVALNGSSQLRILPGLGNGTFGVAYNLSVNAYPGTVEVCDVNHDAIADLVASSQANGVSVLIGIGSGVFVPAASAGIVSSNASATGDINRDGNVDLGNATNFGLTLSLGDGNGSFQHQGLYADAGGPRSIVIADMNGDGGNDLVASNYYSNSVSILHHQEALPGGLLQFGTGTPGCRGVQHVSATSAPQVNNSAFALTCTNAPRLALGLGLATDAATIPGSPDPFGLGILMIVDLLNSGQVFAFDTISDASGMSVVSAPIPNDPLLAGQIFYYQTISLEDAASGLRCGTSPLRVVSSDGLQLTILP